MACNGFALSNNSNNGMSNCTWALIIIAVVFFWFNCVGSNCGCGCGCNNGCDC